MGLLPLTSVDRTTQRIILAVTAMSGFIAAFMASSVNITLPLIEADFHVSAVTLGWIPTAYILATGALLMPVGRIADLQGRTRVYLVGLVVFTVAGFASAVAPSAAVLIAMRAFQGLAAAILFSTHTAIVTLSHPPETRGRALGVLVGCVYLGMTVGPVLGGIIARNAGWRILFVVVGALGLINCILPFWKLRAIDWREPKLARFDVAGSVAWAIALSVLILGFSYLPGTTGVVLIAAGVVALALFFWQEKRAGDPILNVDLLVRNKVFAFSNLASLINYSATAAMTFLMSLYLQYNRALDPQEAGLVLVPGLFVQAVFSVAAGRLADRIPARVLSSVGMGMTALGLTALAFLQASTGWPYIFAALCVLGLGFALFVTPITHTVMGSVEKRHVGTASAILATMRVTGQSLSMGLATLVLALVVGRHEIEPADYPNFLTSTRITFAIFAVLCVLGIGATLVRSKGRAGEMAPAATATAAAAAGATEPAAGTAASNPAVPRQD